MGDLWNQILSNTDLTKVDRRVNEWIRVFEVKRQRSQTLIISGCWSITVMFGIREVSCGLPLLLDSLGSVNAHFVLPATCCNVEISRGLVEGKIWVISCPKCHLFTHPDQASKSSNKNTYFIIFETWFEFSFFCFNICFLIHFFVKMQQGFPIFAGVHNDVNENGDRIWRSHWPVSGKLCDDHMFTALLLSKFCDKMWAIY